MPITRSAIKKLRRDKKKGEENEEFLEKVKQALKKAAREKKPKSVTYALSLIDKATKRHLFHKNKAARLKSKISKLIQHQKKKKSTEKNPKKKEEAAKTPKRNTLTRKSPLTNS